MADVLKPDQFNEIFTLCVDVAGMPVERTLREMSAGEVLVAISWHNAKAERLEAVTAPFAELIEVVHADGEIPPGTTRETVRQAGMALRAFGEAENESGTSADVGTCRNAAMAAGRGYGSRRSFAPLLADGMNQTVKTRPPQRRPLERLACSVEQAAEISGLSVRKINMLISDGRLRSIRIDGRRLIYISSVKALLPDA